MEFTIFIYENVTLHVKAGRRLPARRKKLGQFVAEMTAPLPDTTAADLEMTRHNGQRIRLFTAPLYRPALVGDEITLTIHREFLI